MSLQRAVFPILISITGILTPVLPQTPFDVMSIRERIGQGRLDEAYQLCLHFRSTNPADMDMNRLLVETASYRGRLDQPDSLYRLEIREGRNLSSAYFGEGLVQYHRHNFQKTILFINKALELGCSSPAAMQVLVPSYERAFGSEQTRRYFTILSHRYPGNPNAWYGLALATWGMGNSSTIFEALDHALRLQPEEPRYEQARIAAEAAFAPGAETFKRLDGALAKSLTRLDFEGWCFLMVARVLLHQE
jgi:tetratricopeptide (TPR) repeat protein